MGGWDAVLREIVELNRRSDAGQAARRLGALLDDCPADELRALQPAITRALTSFRTEDRSQLAAVLAARCSTADHQVEPAVADQLATVERLAKQGQSTRASQKFRALLASLTADQVVRHGPVLRTSLGQFKGDPQRALVILLDRRLANAAPPPSPSVAEPVVVNHSPAAPRKTQPTTTASQSEHWLKDRLNYSTDGFSDALDELAKRHIFQWETYYRDTLSQYFDAFLLELENGDNPRPWLNLMKAAISQHATTIFQHGYQYQMSHNNMEVRFAINKSLAGVHHFLELPLVFYSARLADAPRFGFARHLRSLCSAMLLGVLLGYTAAQFHVRGSRILSQNVGWWAHVLPFLTTADMQELLRHVEESEALAGVHDSVLPFVRALDELLRRDAASAPVPSMSLYVEGGRRLEVTLEVQSAAMRSRRVEVHCHVAQLVDRLEIEQAAGRAVALVIGSVSPDLRGQLLGATRLAEIVVSTDDIGGDELHKRLIAFLRDLGEGPDPVPGARPIEFNFATLFPLEDPALARTNFHVYRRSVRRLMESFERRNGVRLWCSVRRSGKTTACTADLGPTSTQTEVVTQTCDSTGQMPDGDLFYDKVQRALASGERLEPDFVAHTVAACLDAPADSRRVVLVLDEYETLFGNLRTSMERDPGLRYTVVQPLLNQLVTFTRDNLLIFMGQQPDAHWILTDQNQLSPVVIQDPFPLFSHNVESNSEGEFYELVQKVMTSHAELDPAFVGELYAETGGHPFLTCKLLISFWDWLIATKRRTSVLWPVRAELFRAFTDASLDYSSIACNQNYDMFIKAAADHLSPGGRQQHPWLHSVYSAMRGLMLETPSTFSLPRGDFLALAERYCVGTSPENLLSTACHANFLIIDQGVVRPRIRLLGRIAAAVRPLQEAG